MSTNDPMSPASSPDRVPPGPGVRRVNNIPLYLIGTVLAVFLLVMVLVAADRADQQARPAAKKEDKAGNTRMFATEIAGKHDEAFIPPDSPPPVAAASSAMPDGPILIARSDNLDLPPTPPGNVSGAADQRSRDASERLRQTKLQQLEEAAKAKTSVTIAATRSGAATPSGSTSNTAVATQDDTRAKLAALRQQMEVSSPEGAAAPQASAPGPSHAGKPYAQFAGGAQEDRWRLDTQPEAPSSPYALRAGFVVPAILISGINAELPGQIMAQVSQDIFDTATGKWKLIPQGSRLIGQYASEVVFGQSRVLVAWQRIVFPDGKALDIGAMPGSDSAGYAGLTDQVNNHYVRLFASAFLLSGVTAGISLSQPQTTIGTTARQSASGAISEALGQQLGQVTAQLIAKNMNTAPTLEIRPGYRFNVVVTKDMTFTKPYAPFDYASQGETQ